MAVDLVALTEGLQALPLPQLIAVATGVVFLAALLMRIFANTFRGKAPPIDEGIPFVGGLIKFSKVRYNKFSKNNLIFLVAAASVLSTPYFFFSTSLPSSSIPTQIIFFLLTTLSTLVSKTYRVLLSL
jgi:hypothetical protein